MSTLVLVMVVLGVVTVMQIAQHFFLGQVTDQSARWHHGRAAQTIAQSALSETVAILGKRVNAESSDPESLFQILRTRLPEQQGQHRFRLEPSELVQTRESMAGYGVGAYDLGPVDVQIAYDQEVSWVNPMEYTGTLYLDAHVSSRLEKNVDRHALTSLVFKVGQLSPMPPLGRSALVVAEPQEMLAGIWDVNDVFKTLHEQDIVRLRVSVQKTVDQIDEGLRKASGPLGAASPFKGFLQAIRPLYSNLAEVFEQEQQMASRFHAYPVPYKDLILVHKQPAVELETACLQHRLEAPMQAVNTSAGKIITTSDRVKADLAQQRADGGAVQDNRDFTAAISDHVNQVARVLQVVVEFQEAFDTLQKDTPRHQLYASAHYLVDPAELAKDHSRFDSRANIDVYEGPGSQITEKLQALFERLDREGRGLHGTILVRNSTQPVLLTGDKLRGHWTIAVKGGLELRNVRAEQQNMVTVVAAGQENQDVRIGGRVDAYVAVTGVRLTIEGGTEIIGGLYLNDLSVQSAARISGKVKTDPRLVDTQTAKFRYVHLSPWSRSLIVQRSSRSLPE